MKPHKKYLTLFLIVMLNSKLALATDLILDTNLTFTYDNNVSLAESNRDVFSDEIVTLKLVASKNLRPNPHSSLSIMTKLSRNQYVRFDALSNTGLALEARYRIQPVIGFYQPWLELGISAEKLGFDDSDIRDGALFNLNLSAHKRFTERINANIGIGAEKRSADSKDVFEWERYNLFLNNQYKWSEDVTLSAGYGFMKGDQVFIATAPVFLQTFNPVYVPTYSPVYPYSLIPNPAAAPVQVPDPYAKANARAPDPIFGQRFVYRLPARANTFNTSINYRINSNNKIDFGLQYAKINAEGNHQYDATQANISWLHRF